MSKDLNSLYDLLRADGSIVINKNLLFAIGNNESIIYCELLSRYNYFNIREELTEDGFFFNKVDDLYVATNLGEKPQRAAIKELKKIGLIDYKVIGMPPKRYFKIIDNTKLILDLIDSGKKKREALEKKLLQDIEKSKFRLKEGINSANREELKTPNGSVNNTNFNNTKPIILNNENGSSGTVNSSSLSSIVLKEYMTYYQQYIGDKHPNLKPKQIERIYQVITNFEKETGLMLSDWKAMINRHFKTDYGPDVDYNANHFFTQGILQNRFYEECY